MKDTRFIELVNLYVDRQISAVETAELEVEIQASPQRRKIYQQYCHMHRATKLVYESFRTNADQPGVEVALPGSSIAQFEHTRQKSQRSRWYYSLASTAAAACLTVVVIRAGLFSSADANQAAVQPTAAAVAAVSASSSQPAAVLPSADSQAALAEQKYAALLSAMRQEEMRAYAVSQQSVTKPISLFADNVFDEKQVLSAEGQKVFQLKRKTESRDSSEFTAFQFQR